MNSELHQLDQAVRIGDAAAGLDAAVAVLRQCPPGSESASRALQFLDDLAERREEPVGLEACWLLGSYYLMHLNRPGAMTILLDRLRTAADAGMLPALDRLANLHLRGLGVESSLDQALELIGRLADDGVQQSAWDRGYLLNRAGDAAGAVTAFARACAIGFGPAYYSLGLRYALGAGVDADPAFGRALLCRAEDAGYPDAREAADELAPQARCGPQAADWYRRLKRRHDRLAARFDALLAPRMTLDPERRALVAELEAAFAGVGHPSWRLDASGRLVVAPGGSDRPLCARPDSPEPLSKRPRVELRRNFLTREECSWLMFVAAQSMGRPGDYELNTDNGQLEASLFDGSGRSLGPLDSDAVVRSVEQRIADAFSSPPEFIEPVSIIRYTPGEEYRPHVDFFRPDQLERNERDGTDLGGQRVATILLCLHPAEAGGETEYPEAAVSVRYERGMLAAHFNVLPDGRPDPASIHRGRPVERGEKWLLRTTLREKTRYPNLSATAAGSG